MHLGSIPLYCYTYKQQSNFHRICLHLALSVNSHTFPYITGGLWHTRGRENESGKKKNIIAFFPGTRQPQVFPLVDTSLIIFLILLPTSFCRKNAKRPAIDTKVCVMCITIGARATAVVVKFSLEVPEQTHLAILTPLKG